MTRTKAYVIVAGTGSYSDRYTWPAVVLTNKDAAQNLMLQLETIYKSYQSKLKGLGYNERWEEEKRLNPAITSEYTALAVQGDAHICDVWTDWALEESWILSNEHGSESNIGE